jgi:ABC-type multidrug transport system ATPase subunit
MDLIAKLVLVKDGAVVEKFAFPGSEAITLHIGNGRSAEPVDMAIPSSLVSRHHACISGDGKGQLFLRDLGSTNGTFLNNEQIPSNQDVPISPEVTINFSPDPQYQLLVVEPDSTVVRKATAAPASVEPDATVARNTITAPAPREVQESQKSILDVLQTKDTAVIGRNPDCDIVISDDTVSRQHARIDKTGQGSYRITDLDSTNGTFVSGRKVHGHTDLSPDDLILIGDFRLSLKGVTQDIREAIAIRAEGIVKQYPNGYLGLKETSIEIPAQSLLAIMGPSGCGKSTLMKALNGDDPTTAGRVFIHDLELTSNYEYLKPRIGYVPQDDIVHRELTVEKSLYFAAKLRMDNPGDAEIGAKIDQILKNLNIEHIRKSMVGKISGGQRKRVSIAVELLTDPLILFLDEPTSPLDPQTIEEFLDILRGLADKGTTVIMVTHKPEDLNYMDSVVFMAEGGHLVFYGPTTDYKEYFKVDNTVQVYAGISGTQSESWVKQYKSRQAPASSNQDPVPSAQPEHLETSPVRQFYWLTMRYLNIKINDRVNTAILLAQAPIIAILLCIIFQDIVPAVPFLMSISAIWFGASNAAREIVGELPIYRRERMFNLKITPYILSKLTVLTLFSALQATMFVAILALRFSDAMFSGNDPVWNNPLAATGWMLFLSVSATMMGLLLSAAMDTTEKVMALVPIILIPQIILAGFIARITNWGVELISWLTLARWGTEGFHVIQDQVYGEQTVVNNVMDASGNVTNTTTQVQSGPVSAVDALSNSFLDSYSDGSLFGSLTNTLTLDTIFVASLGLLFFVLTWFSLRKKDTL